MYLYSIAYILPCSIWVKYKIGGQTCIDMQSLSHGKYVNKANLRHERLVILVNSYYFRIVDNYSTCFVVLLFKRATWPVGRSSAL